MSLSSRIRLGALASLYKSPSRIRQGALASLYKSPSRIRQGALASLYKSPSRIRQGAVASLYKSRSRLLVKKKKRRVGEFVQVAFLPSWPLNKASLYKSASRLLIKKKAPWRVCTSRLLAFFSWPKQGALASLYKSSSRILVLDRAPWPVGEFVQVAIPPLHQRYVHAVLAASKNNGHDAVERLGWRQTHL